LNNSTTARRILSNVMTVLLGEEKFSANREGEVKDVGRK
jgi:hypothetical protein